jgi:hypothetical protein
MSKPKYAENLRLNEISYGKVTMRKHLIAGDGFN